MMKMNTTTEIKDGKLLGKNRLALLLQPKHYFPLIILLFVILMPQFLPKYMNHVLIYILIFSSTASAWNIIGGYGGQLSLGHAAYFGIGAYSSTLLYHYFGITPWLGMFVGGGLSVLISWGIGTICFRMKGPYFVIATIALAEVMRFLFTSQHWLTMGAQGVSIKYRGNAPLFFQFSDKRPYVYLSLLLLLVIVYVVKRIEKSREGYYLVAIGQNQQAAEAVGVDVVKAKRNALATSAFFTAITGTFFAQYIYFIDPDAVFGFSISVSFATFAAIGGLGTVWGPVIGTVAMKVISEASSSIFGSMASGLQLLIYGLFLVTIVLMKPKGLIGPLTTFYNKILMILPGKKVKGE